MERAAQWVAAVLFTQGTGRLDRRVRDLLVVLDGLEGALRKVLCVLAPEQLRFVGLVVGIRWARDERQHSGDSESDRRRGLETIVIDLNLVLQARHRLVNRDAGRGRQDGEKWVDKDVICI